MSRVHLDEDMEAELHPVELSRKEKDDIDRYEQLLEFGIDVEEVEPDLMARYREIKESGR